MGDKITITRLAVTFRIRPAASAAAAVLLANSNIAPAAAPTAATTAPPAVASDDRFSLAADACFLSAEIRFSIASAPLVSTLKPQTTSSSRTFRATASSPGAGRDPLQLVFVVEREVGHAQPLQGPLRQHLLVRREPGYGGAPAVPLGLESSPDDVSEAVDCTWENRAAVACILRATARKISASFLDSKGP